MPDSNLIICLKNDPTLNLERGQAVVVIASNEDDWQPIVDTPSENSQEQVGIVFQDSLANRKTVQIKFSGTALIKFTVGFFQPSPSIGDSVGTLAGDLTPKAGETGIGVILAIDERPSPIIGGDGFAFVKLTGGAGETIVRWLEFNP